MCASAGRGVTVVEERELWNMPIVLITLMGSSVPNGRIAAWWGCLMLKAFLLIVVGLAGDPEHGKTFHKWGADSRGVEPLGRAARAAGLPSWTSRVKTRR